MVSNTCASVERSARPDTRVSDDHLDPLPTDCPTDHLTE